MCKWFDIKKKKRESLNATRRAKRRWALDRDRRDELAAKDPIRIGGKIIERIVRILNEREVRECTIFEFDRPCDVRRKKRALFA
jgi:hypothetical protein